MIDCDIHIYGGDEEILSHVDPAQRDWFRLQGGLGLPGYPFGHPTGWFRHDSEYELGTRDGNSLEATQHQLLDALGVDIGVLTASYGLAVSLMTSSYRAETFARAHNEWMRERWLEQEPRLRGSIVCPAQEPRAAAAEICRVAEDDRFVQVLLIGGSERPYGDPRYLPIFEAAAEWLETEGFRGCPYLNTSVEIPDQSHPARRIVQEYLDEVQAWLRSVLTAARFVDAELLAMQLQALLAGSISLAVARHTGAFALSAREAVGRLLADAERHPLAE